MVTKAPPARAPAFKKSRTTSAERQAAQAVAGRIAKAKVVRAVSAVDAVAGSEPGGTPDETVATTLRLDPAVRRGLVLIRRTTGVTMNKLVNEAVALYVAERVKTIEHDLRAALDRIRQYHAIDQTYAAQAEQIAAEEATHARSDPIEGRMVADRSPAPRREANSRSRRRAR